MVFASICSLKVEAFNEAPTFYFVFISLTSSFVASVCPSFACVYVVTHNAGISRLAPPAVIEGFRSLVYNSLSFLFPQAVFKLKITHPPIHLSHHHLQFTLPVC